MVYCIFPCSWDSYVDYLCVPYMHKINSEHAKVAYIYKKLFCKVLITAIEPMHVDQLHVMHKNIFAKAIYLSK